MNLERKYPIQAFKSCTIVSLSFLVSLLRNLMSLCILLLLSSSRQTTSPPASQKNWRPGKSAPPSVFFFPFRLHSLLSDHSHPSRAFKSLLYIQSPSPESLALFPSSQHWYRRNIPQFSNILRARSTQTETQLSSPTVSVQECRTFQKDVSCNVYVTNTTNMIQEISHRQPKKGEGVSNQMPPKSKLCTLQFSYVPYLLKFEND